MKFDESLLFFSARRMKHIRENEGACQEQGLLSKSVFKTSWNCGLIRTIKVLGRRRLVRYRRRRHHRREIVGAIDKSVFVL